MWTFSIDLHDAIGRTEDAGETRALSPEARAGSMPTTRMSRLLVSCDPSHAVGILSNLDATHLFERVQIDEGNVAIGRKSHEGP
jgi:hypothetical protein